MSPIDTLPEADKRWLMHIGYLAQTWAALEHSLDGIARQIHAHYDTEKVEPVPISFNRKRDYIRRMLARHPKLVEFSKGINEILDAATTHSEVRNWALHSGMAGIDDTVTFNRWRKAELAHEQRALSLQEVYEAASGCASLTLALGILGRYIFGFQSRQETEKLLGEVASKLRTPFPGNKPAG